MKLIVVTVNYCCAKAILEGLSETVEQLRVVGDAEYWIVDNASPDASLSILQQGIDALSCQDVVSVIGAESNNGFGAGNNVAMRKALSQKNPPQFFYFLNPDAIPEKGALQELLRFMTANPSVGVAGGLLCDEAGQVQSSLFRFPSALSEIENAFNIGPIRRLFKEHILPLETPTQPIPVDWVAGTSFIVRREVVERAGLFDEGFFLYWEEIEWCHRIKQIGYEVFAVPDVVVMHTGGVSTGMHNPDKRFPEYWFASRQYFFRTTNLIKYPILTDLVVSFGLAIQRLYQFARRRKRDSPYFLRDFIRFSFFKSPRRN